MSYKKIITIVFLTLSLVCSGISVEAQKKKTSKRTTSSITVKMGNDGYPNIVGHTYRYSGSDGKIDFTINNKNVKLTVSQGKKSVSDSSAYYTYEGGYLKIYDPAVPNTPMFDGEVSEDGKSIILISGYVLKLLK